MLSMFMNPISTFYLYKHIDKYRCLSSYTNYIFLKEYLILLSDFVLLSFHGTYGYLLTFYVFLDFSSMKYIC